MRIIERGKHTSNAQAHFQDRRQQAAKNDDDSAGRGIKLEVRADGSVCQGRQERQGARVLLLSQFLLLCPFPTLSKATHRLHMHAAGQMALLNMTRQEFDFESENPIGKSLLLNSSVTPPEKSSSARGLLSYLDALLNAQSPDFLHQQKDLIAPRRNVLTDLFQLQLCKVLCTHTRLESWPRRFAQKVSKQPNYSLLLTLTDSRLSMMQKFSGKASVSNPLQSQEALT